jgi:type II secretory pathway pseudopilin PulG
MILIFIILATIVIIRLLNGYDEAKQAGVVNNEYTTEDNIDNMDK